MENLNLDDLFADDLEEIVEEEDKTSYRKKENKKTKKKPKKALITPKVQELLVKSVLPTTVALVVGVGVGATLFSVNETQESVKTVSKIKATSSVIENTENVKNSQINSLKQQLATLTNKTENGTTLSSSVDKTSFDFVKTLNDNTVKTLDPFFDKLLKLKPNATDNELKALAKDIQPFFVKEFNEQKIIDFLKQNNASKALKTETNKVASVTATMAFSSNENARTYIIIVPFGAKNQKVYNAFYTLTTDKEHKISDIQYSGYSNDTDVEKLHKLFNK